MSYSMRNTALTPAEAATLIAEIRDQATGAERLAEIAREWTPPFGEAKGQGATLLGPLAARADLPPAELSLLLPVRPHEACRNPALPLAVLEAPHLFTALSPNSKRVVLRLGQAPPTLVALWASSAEPEPALRHEARMHVALAGEVGEGEDWHALVFEHWRDHAARARWERRQQYVELVELGLATDWVAGSEPWPEPFSHERYMVRVQQRADPQLPTLTPEEAATTADGIVRKAREIEAGTGIPLPEGAARTLFRRKHDAVRLAVARHPDSPAALLAALGVPDMEVAYALATHPNAGRALLASLARNGNVSLRRLTLRHPLFPAAELPAVRERVLEDIRQRSHNSPLAYFLSLISSDTRPQELRRLVQSRDTSYEKDAWRWRLAAAIGLPASDAWYLETLAKDGNRLVRAAARGRLRGEEFAWPGGWNCLT